MKKILRTIKMIMIALAGLFILEGCYETHYYNHYHHHTREWYGHRHQPPPPDVDFRLDVRQ